MTNIRHLPWPSTSVEDLPRTATHVAHFRPSDARQVMESMRSRTVFVDDGSPFCRSNSQAFVALPPLSTVPSYRFCPKSGCKSPTVTTSSAPEAATQAASIAVPGCFVGGGESRRRARRRKLSTGAVAVVQADNDGTHVHFNPNNVPHIQSAPSPAAAAAYLHGLSSAGDDGQHSETDATRSTQNSAVAGDEVDEMDCEDDDGVVASQQRAFVNRVSLLGKRQRVQEVLSTMEHVKAQGSPPFNLIMCNACITALARCGRWRQALAILDGMRQTNTVASDYDDVDALRSICDCVRPDVVSYSSAITACGNAGQRRRALSLLGDMRAEGVPPNVVSYNAAAYACVRADDLANESEGMRIEEISTDASAIRRSGGRGWALVLGLMSEMRSDGLVPDAFTWSTAITACGRAGEWQRALMLLEEIGLEEEGVAPDVVSVNAAIAACGRAGEFDRGLDLLRRMTSSVDSLTESLERAGDQDSIGEDGEECGSEADEEARRRWPRPDSWSFNIAMELCAKAGRWRDGLALLSEMRKVGIPPDVHSYAAALACYRSGGQWERALKLLDALEEAAEANLYPDLGCYGAVLATLGEAGRWKAALELLRRLQQPEQTKNSVASAVKRQLGTGREQVGRLDGSGIAVGTVSASAAAGPNLICYNAVLAACAKAGEVSIAFSLLHEMEERDVFNVVSFNSVLHACRLRGEWRKAVALLNRMRNRASTIDSESPAERGILSTASDLPNNSNRRGEYAANSHQRRPVPAPDKYSFTSAITACGAAGQVDRALELLGAMKDAGVPANEVAFNAAISAVGRGILRRDYVPASTASRDFAASGTTPGHQQPWQRARALLDDMRAVGVSPSVKSYNAVLAACQRAGAWQDSLELLSELTSGAKKILRPSSTATSYAYGIGPGTRLKTATPDPDVVSFNTVIGACGKVGRWREALVLLEEITSWGLSPDAVSYNSAAAACARAEKWETAFEVLELGRRTGVIRIDAEESTSDDVTGRSAGDPKGDKAAASSRRGHSDAGFYASVEAMARRARSERVGEGWAPVKGGTDDCSGTEATR